MGKNFTNKMLSASPHIDAGKTIHKPTNLNTSLEVNMKNIDTGVRFSPHIDAGKISVVINVIQMHARW